jgi:uncharacterized spore protein YtfJ
MDDQQTSTTIDSEGARRPASALERLGEVLGSRVSAVQVYAPPVERDGITVIPVARARWGFGMGGGGVNGGGGVMLSPVGYIEIKDGQARFRPIYEPLALLPGLIAAVALAALLAQIVARALGPARQRSK